MSWCTTRLQCAMVSILLTMGCAHSANKAVVYTEEGLRAAETTWDGYYRFEAERCESRYEPKTPEMEECFGSTYDADAKVAEAVQSAVALLRTYWLARATGKDPDFAELMREVQKIVDDLPPEAGQYFARVKGVP